MTRLVFATMKQAQRALSQLKDASARVLPGISLRAALNDSPKLTVNLSISKSTLHGWNKKPSPVIAKTNAGKGTTSSSIKSVSYTVHGGGRAKSGR